ncbi:hypothetical protein AGMMS49938_13310 [Fibrobacterales bacterium]|nr:hypothetical protein AGMMS49938_13310 [Fibrobacterales bacterium]
MIYTEWNWDDALRVRKEEGIQEGLQKGLQRVLATAKNLLAKGYPLTDIIEATGLSEPEVKALKLSNSAKKSSLHRK